MKIFGRPIPVKYTLVGICIFCILSCKKENEPQDKIIDPGKFIKEEIKLSDLVSEIKYILFSQDILFRQIYQSDFSDEFIFLSTDQGILRYTYTGEYLGKIGGIGQGPMEYIYAHDFTIDQESKRIYVRDIPYIKVFSFDGKFIKSIPLQEKDPRKIVYSDGKLYLFNLLMVSPEKTNAFWSVMDTTGKVIDEKKNYDVIFEGNGMTYGIYPYKKENRVGYWNHFNDTIFHIYNDRIESAYIWSKGNYRLTTENILLDDGKEFLTLTRLFDTNNFLYITYSQYGKSNICIYNKNKDRFSNMVIDKGIENDINHGLPMDPKQMVVIAGQEYFVQTIYPSALIEYIEENDIKNSSLIRLKNQMAEEDNQMIILYKLR